MKNNPVAQQFQSMTHEKRIDAIVEIEWQMFSKVKSAGPTDCQTNHYHFRKIRESIFQQWPSALLRAYLVDLQIARDRGRNLMTEKYARMDKLLPPKAADCRIERIVEIESRWQVELEATYPAVFARFCRRLGSTENGSNFSVYLRCELETYGDETLSQYLTWVDEGDKNGANYSMAMLEQLVREGGFDNLTHAEQYFKHT